jgi:hypothetical protein
MLPLMPVPLHCVGGLYLAGAAVKAYEACNTDGAVDTIGGGGACGVAAGVPRQLDVAQGAQKPQAATRKTRST